MSKVILISQIELPSSSIGSWTTLYKNYLEGNHEIDYLICPEPKNKFNNITYQFTSHSFIDKIKSKIYKKSHLSALAALSKIVKNDGKYIIQVIDNYKIVPDIVSLLQKLKIRENCKIQFFYHGFPPYLDKEKGLVFFQNIDELILLTQDSHKAHLRYYSDLPCMVSILPNAIDANKFYKLDTVEKENQKQILNITGKQVFLWCSQDRPKKGLQVALDLWNAIYEPNRILLIIGSSRTEQIPGVIFLGKIPNSELPKYYQVSDVYLFPTLCEEGFGLSLIEALSCGCYCIASALGGVPEVLQYGKYGKLINNPLDSSEWELAITEYCTNPIAFEELPNNLYTFENWRSGMNRIINEAKVF